MEQDNPAPRPGCYIDSHNGHYSYPAVIRLAIGYGYEADEEMVNLLARYDRDSHEADYPFEQVIEESDTAIDWLNEHVPLDGHVWEWFDGDFGLYQMVEEDDL